MKLIFTFNTTSAAKSFCDKAKKLPYVTYANDYMSRQGYKAMVCTGDDITDAQKQEILSLKSHKKCKA